MGMPEESCCFVVRGWITFDVIARHGSLFFLNGDNVAPVWRIIAKGNSWRGAHHVAMMTDDTDVFHDNGTDPRQSERRSSRSGTKPERHCRDCLHSLGVR